MGLFPALAIGIVIFVIVIVIIIAVVLFNTTSSNSSPSSSCQNQNDCSPGYVCTDANICKAGLGTSCNADDDCAPDFVCSTSTNTCSNKSTPLTQWEPPVVRQVVRPQYQEQQNITIYPPTSNYQQPVQHNYSFVNDQQPNYYVHPSISNQYQQRHPINNNYPINGNNYSAVNNSYPTSVSLNNNYPAPMSLNNSYPTSVSLNNNYPTSVSLNNNYPAPMSVSTSSFQAPMSVGTSNYSEPPISINSNSNYSAVPISVSNNSNYSAVPISANNSSNYSAVPISAGNNSNYSAVPISASNNSNYSNSVSLNNNNYPATSINNNSAVPISGNSNSNYSAVPVNNSSNLSAVANNHSSSGSSNYRLSITDVFTRAATSCSTDDEINSCGTKSDSPFDVRSGTSTDARGERRSSVSTPCNVRDNAYYCRGNDNVNEKSPVIDVCSYSTSTLFLLEDGNIICEATYPEKSRTRVSTNVTLRRITSFDGYIYGIGIDGCLYTLPNSLFNSTLWNWNLCTWAPTNIKHISSTQDSNYLWVQTNSTGYIYNKEDSLQEEISYTNGKRVYGRDVNNYIDINQVECTAIVYPGRNVINNVYDAALSYYGEVMSIHPDDKHKYRGITIVNWFPYYINV